ncbi:MAG: hypothetical protein HYX92_06920 [Chloroflexi bacterium]|nr:hypothetical protein [Chloroflexota bacterium]
MGKPNFLIGIALAALMLVLAACATEPQKSPPAATNPGPLLTPTRTTAPNSVAPSPAAGAVPGSPRRISPQAAREKIDRGIDVTIVDVRSKAEFDQLRISGAISLPLEELDRRYVELRKESQIILY